MSKLLLPVIVLLMFNPVLHAKGSETPDVEVSMKCSESVATGDCMGEKKDTYELYMEQVTKATMEMIGKANLKEIEAIHLEYP